MQTIYVRLLEGAITYVPCKAKCIFKDIYQIAEIKEIDLENDATAIWEFFPGDKVRCNLKIDKFLPYGKVEEILIAEELISLSQSFLNRKVFQLIFLIVSKLGDIDREKLQGFEEEIEYLCKTSEIVQKKHPIVKAWLEKYCKN